MDRQESGARLDLKRERRLFGSAFGLVTALSIAVMGCFWYRGNLPPTIKLPPPLTMPASNAFDDFNRAYSLLKDQKAIDASLVSGRLLKADLSNGLKDISDGDAERIDTENAPMFAMLRVGLTHQYVAPPVKNFAQLFYWLKNDRELADALSFDSYIAARHQDWARVALDSVTTLKLANAVEQRAQVIPRLTGIEIERTGRQKSWACANHANEDECQSLTKAIEDIDHTRPPFWQSVYWERIDAETCLVNVLSQIDPISGGKSGLIQIAEQSLYYTVRPKQNTIKLYGRYMKHTGSDSQMNYAIAIKSLALPIPNDTMCEISTPHMREVYFKDVENLSYNHLLLASLALRAYSLDHGGAYPVSLAALVPRYVSRVPTDPFVSSTMPLVYRCAKSVYTLYSIGPDGIDNGGAATIHHDLDHGASYRGSGAMTDQGDIVAGVNVD